MLFDAGCIEQNKCFHLNPKIKLLQIRLIVFEKNTKTHVLILNITSLSRRLGYSNTN